MTATTIKTYDCGCAHYSTDHELKPVAYSKGLKYKYPFCDVCWKQYEYVIQLDYEDSHDLPQNVALNIKKLKKAVCYNCVGTIKYTQLREWLEVQFKEFAKYSVPVDPQLGTGANTGPTHRPEESRPEKIMAYTFKTCDPHKEDKELIYERIGECIDYVTAKHKESEVLAAAQPDAEPSF